MTWDIIHERIQDLVIIAFVVAWAMRAKFMRGFFRGFAVTVLVSAAAGMLILMAIAAHTFLNKRAELLSRFDQGSAATHLEDDFDPSKCSYVDVPTSLGRKTVRFCPFERGI